jgi:hypothetical protein
MVFQSHQLVENVSGLIIFYDISIVDNSSIVSTDTSFQNLRPNWLLRRFNWRQFVSTFVHTFTTFQLATSRWNIFSLINFFYNSFEVLSNGQPTCHFDISNCEYFYDISINDNSLRVSHLDQVFVVIKLYILRHCYGRVMKAIRYVPSIFSR